MGNYDGRAELLDASGHVVDTVEVTLESSLEGNRKSREWGGTIDNAAATGPAWNDVARIRLSGGREGQVKIAGDYIGSASRFGLITVSGPAPFRSQHSALNQHNLQSFVRLRSAHMCHYVRPVGRSDRP